MYSVSLGPINPYPKFLKTLCGTTGLDHDLEATRRLPAANSILRPRTYFSNSGPDFDHDFFPIPYYNHDSFLIPDYDNDSVPDSDDESGSDISI